MGGAGGMGGMGGMPPGMGMNPAMMQQFMQMQGMGGGMGGMGGMPQADSRPPREKYASELAQIKEMGFTDEETILNMLQ